MRAAVMVKRGTAKESLKIEEWPLPETKPGQVLVAVAATSVNCGEW